MQLPPPPSARRHLRVGGRTAVRARRRRQWSRDFSRGRRASEPNAPGREVSVRLNIAACHDRRLFVASEKGINDTPARDTPLTLLLVHARARTRANTEYITMNYLRPDAHFFSFFEYAKLFLSFTWKSARGDVLFRCECADCKLQSTNCRQAEPLGLFRMNRFTQYHFVKDLVCLCVFQNVLPHTRYCNIIELWLPTNERLRATIVAQTRISVQFSRFQSL